MDDFIKLRVKTDAKNANEEMMVVFECKRMFNKTTFITNYITNPVLKYFVEQGGSLNSKVFILSRNCLDRIYLCSFGTLNSIK